jgi:hypothetical protein
MIDRKLPEIDTSREKAQHEHSAVTFHIERLVLDNIPLESRQATELQTTVERELRRLIVRNGLKRELIATGATPFIGTRGIELSRAMNPRRLGNQIARAIYSGLKV